MTPSPTPAVPARLMKLRRFKGFCMSLRIRPPPRRAKSCFYMRLGGEPHLRHVSVRVGVEGAFEIGTMLLKNKIYFLMHDQARLALTATGFFGPGASD